MLDRDLGKMLAIAAALLAGLLLILWYATTPQVQSLASSVRTVEPTNPPGKQGAKNKARNPTSRPARTKTTPPADGSEIPLPIPVFEMRVPVPPFPKAGDADVGHTSKEIKKTYGSPDVSATWTMSGSLVEKYIYLSSHESTTFILDNGRVVSARTEPSVLSVAH